MGPRDVSPLGDMASETLFSIKCPTLENQGHLFSIHLPSLDIASLPQDAHLTGRKCLLVAAGDSLILQLGPVPWALFSLALAISAALPACPAVPHMMNWMSCLDST